MTSDEENWSVWNLNCKQIQQTFSICTNNEDANQALIMEHCPYTCAIAYGICEDPDPPPTVAPTTYPTSYPTAYPTTDPTSYPTTVYPTESPTDSCGMDYDFTIYDTWYPSGR
jgi:hypothetical protein